MGVTYNIEHLVAIDCDAVRQIDALYSLVQEPIFVSIFQNAAEDAEGYNQTMSIATP